jgi:hypothetical protein
LYECGESVSGFMLNGLVTCLQNLHDLQLKAV